MRIPGYSNAKISDVYLRHVRASQRKDTGDTRAASGSRKTKKDEIVLSPRATEIRELEGAAKAIPEVRQEKVEAIKGQIESKTYTANGKLVAQSIADLLG